MRLDFGAADIGCPDVDCLAAVGGGACRIQVKHCFVER